MDGSSVAMKTALNRRRPLDAAFIEFTQATGTRLVQYQIQITNVVVTGLSESSGGGTISEHITLFSTFIATSRRVIDPAAPSFVEDLAWWDSVAFKGGTSLPGIDTDLDGIPDDYEVANALNRLADDAAQDLDGDGMSNLAEFIAGTSANDAGSVLRITRVLPAGGTGLQVFWSAVAGHKYDVQISGRAEGSYQAVATVLAGATGELNTTVPRSPGFTFVRVQALQ